jgi:hypothetical protein
MEKETPESLAELRHIVENAIGKMGFRPKRIRIPYIVRSKSRYSPHQGNKERAKAQKRLIAEAERELRQNPERLPL